MRTFLMVACAVTAATTLAACAGSDSTSGTSDSSGALIGSDYPRSDTDFWNAYVRYTPIQAKDLGITNIKTTNSENDVSKLTSNVQTLLSQSVDWLIVQLYNARGSWPESSNRAG